MRGLLAAPACALALAATAAGPAPATAIGPPVTVEAHFTPGDDIAGVIAGHVAAARRSVQVQAFLFTHRGIAAALAKAARRGVAVDVVADARQHEAGGFPVARQLDRAGVRVWLHGSYAALHNKVVLVDAESDRPVVITGSFNLTQSAQTRNAENIVVITGHREAARRYARDFARHRDAASRLQ